MAEALDTEPEGPEPSWGQDGETCASGKRQKKPTDAALGSSLPCQGASAAAPPPAPLLAPPSEEAKVRVLGLIGKTETTSPRLPCTGFCKEDVTASTGQGPAETQDQPCSPAPNRSARAAGERPSPFDSCKGGWDTITQGSLNGTCVRFDKGKPWLLTIRREGQRQNSPRGSSPKTSAHGKPGPNQRTPKAKEVATESCSCLLPTSVPGPLVGSSLG